MASQDNSKDVGRASRIMETIMAGSSDNEEDSHRATHLACSQTQMPLPLAATLFLKQDNNQAVTGESIGSDICRVCRLSDDKELYHPCQCIGSIKYVHQECLLKWLKYSKKEVCELCSHKFVFQPVYAKNMPPRLPLSDIIKAADGEPHLQNGLFPSLGFKVGRDIRNERKKVFQLVSFENVWLEVAGGVSIVSVFLCTFISLVWLREQIMTSAPATFLHLPVVEEHAAPAHPPPAADTDEGEENVEEDGGEEASEGRDTTLNTDTLIAKEESPDPSSSTPIGDDLDDAVGTLSSADAGTFASPLTPLIQPRAVISVESEESENVAAGDDAEPPGENADGGAENGEHDELAAEADRDEVERIVDDLTWQRLLGLDGTFVFIEHVFWCISLNVAFNVFFLYWPERLGHCILELVGLTDLVTYFQMPVCVLIGYALAAIVAKLVHSLSRVFRLKLVYTLSAIAYLTLKVFLLIVLEVILFPIICGWWLDVCSLPLTGATLDSRIDMFRSYPSSSTFLHWLVGMVYVFYSASFILLLKDLLRPGVLWFIRNLNDPEFNPIFEMIDQPIAQHLRRFVSSISLFFTIVLLVIYAPLQLIRRLSPSTLPYQFSASADTPLGEFSLELILLQIVLPTVLEYSRAFSIMKVLVRAWCRWVGGILGLEAYLLPASHRYPPRRANVAAIPLEGAPNNENNEQPAPQGDAEAGNAAPLPNPRENHLAARHQALLMMREPTNHEDYEKPSLFAARVVALIACLALTFVIFSFAFFLTPVSVGRFLLSYITDTQVPIHDLYTMATGLYVSWLVIKVYALTHEWFEKGWSYVKKAFHSTAWLVLKLIAAAIPLIGMIPFLLGLYFQLLVVGPLRATVRQTPLFFPLKEWAMGVVHFKIFCATVMMGPDWWMKSAIERIYVDGVRGFRLRVLYSQLVIPLLNFISFQIAFPYVAAKLAVFLLRLGKEEEVNWTRYSYPLCLLAMGAVAFIYWQWTELMRLVEKIRNDKYLIGTRLVNFYRKEANADSGQRVGKKD